MSTSPLDQEVGFGAYDGACDRTEAEHFARSSTPEREGTHAAEPRISSNASARAFDPTLRNLHEKWTSLVDEANRLEIGVDEMMMTQAGRSWPYVSMREGCVVSEAAIDSVLARRPAPQTTAEREELDRERAAYRAKLAADIEDFEATARRLWLMPMVERAMAIKPMIEGLLDEIYEAPIDTVHDFAGLLDVALEKEIDIVGEAQEHEKTPATLAFTGRLLRMVMALVPGFEFTSLRRGLTPEQYDALCAPADAAPSELVGLILHWRQLQSRFGDGGEEEENLFRQITALPVTARRELLSKAAMLKAQCQGPFETDITEALALSLVSDIECWFSSRQPA